jgi:hypothetical protein
MKQNHVTLAWVRKQIERHRSLLADLEATERVMLQGADETPAPAASPRVIPSSPSPPPPSSPSAGTKKLIMLRIIAEAPNGCATRDIISKMKADGDQGRNTRNTSPQLSGMGKDGLLTVKDGVWHITKAGRDRLSSAKE